MTTKDRYTGIQSVFATAHDEACLFLCILSIAEEYTGKEIDFIYAYRTALKNELIDKTFSCLDQEKLLAMLTSRKWHKTVVKTLPGTVPVNMYTVEKWYNDRTKFIHFKRRGFDTLYNSVTVKEGSILEYYCYTVEG